MKPNRKAFTLIELLIVVAILAILAAVAAPNFLEAQTRSKVTRVKSDMRTLATAIESYCVDHNVYPWTTSTFQPLVERFRQITTPIAYISTVPGDPFRRKSGEYLGPGDPRDPRGEWYLYNTANNLVGPGNPNPESEDRFGWSLTSGGPDTQIDFPYYPFAQTFLLTGEHMKFIYDPTNGTVSDGDIFLRGGRVRTAISALDWR